MLTTGTHPNEVYRARGFLFTMQRYDDFSYLPKIAECNCLTYK